jgi:fermentation-respiration switch protein FrsA (DUF1100 family)
MTLLSIWQKVSFHNSYGHKLAGLLCSSNNSPANKIAVVCHGFTGSKEGSGKALGMAEEMARRGWSVLLFDFAGCGESEGLFEELSLSRHIDDLNSALNWCKEKRFTKIITIGRSFGGATVVCQAARDKTAAGVCAWATPSTRLKKLFSGSPVDNQNRTVLNFDKGVFYLQKSFFTDLKQYNVAEDAARISPRPLLIIHGTKDDQVTPDNAKAIYEKAREPKKLVWIENGDHQFSRRYKQAWRAVFDWMAQF